MPDLDALLQPLLLPFCHFRARCHANHGRSRLCIARRERCLCTAVVTRALCVGGQDAWGFFVLYMAFSRFGKLKLGKDTEKPAFDDYTWFSLLFCCGIGIGLYMWGVSEPMYYYRGYGNALFKTPFQNDDQFAQQAIFITLYHWFVAPESPRCPSVPCTGGN